MNKNEVFRLTGWILFLILFAGCTSPVYVTSLPTPTTFTPRNTVTVTQITPGYQEAQPTPGFSPTPWMDTPVAGLTPTPWKETPTPDLSPTSKPSPTETTAAIQKEIPICPNNGSPIALADDFGIPGTIVYENYSEFGLYTIGGTPLVRSQLPGSANYKNIVFGFSPDGEWLAYAPLTRKSTLERGVSEDGSHRTVTGSIVFEDPILILLSASGDRVERAFEVAGIEIDAKGGLWVEEDLRWVLGSWINTQLMHTYLFFDDATDAYARGLYYDRLFDPFVGAWVDEPLAKLERFVDQSVAFSPDMTRALFATKRGSDVNGIALQDMQNDVVIWSDAEFYPYPIIPIEWSPDSAYMAVSELYPEADQILLISRDGVAKTLPALPAPLSGRIKFAWSANSRYLAVLTKVHVDWGEIVDKLYLYDIETGLYLFACPFIDYNVFDMGMIWSPDSTYLALNVHDPVRTLLLMDARTGELYELMQDASIVGWSDKFPVEWP